MGKEKKRRGDRKDAYLVRDVDSMHFVMPYNLPTRVANEAVLNEFVDITAMEEFLAKKNAGENGEGVDFKYTLFHVISAAIAKTIVLRPKMNYFYSGNKLWEKKDIRLSFVVKKKFEDDSLEVLANVFFDRTGMNPLQHVHDEVKKIVTHVRVEGKSNDIGDTMDFFKKLPRWVVTLVFKILRWMEFHGIYPSSLMSGDPYYASCFITNLGSIKMHAQYHHLADWGTNSLFCIIGEKKPSAFVTPDGGYEVKNAVEIGVTVDERIADGVYFAKSIRLVKHLLAHPELLELPIETPVDFE